MAIKIQGNSVLQHDGAGYSSTNIAIGYQALLNNTTGTNNTGVGYNAGASITSGSQNVVIGGYTGLSGPISQTGSNYIVLSDGAANIRLMSDSSGNIGIGTTSPGYKLDVSGTGRFTGALTLGTALGVASGGTGLTSLTAGYIPYGNGTGAFGSSANFFYDGRLCIGAAVNNAANGRLQITGANRALDSNGVVNIFTSDAADVNVGGSIGLGGKNGSAGVYDPWTFAHIRGSKENGTSGNLAGYFAIGTSNSGGTIAERMRITSDGKVGIGTSSPSSGAKLEVYGNSAYIAQIASTTAGVSQLWALSSDWSSTPSYRGTGIWQYGPSATGTTCGVSNAELGVLTFQNCTAGLILTNGASPVVFGTTGQERMRITSGGLVGIGTSSPSTTLTVAGATTITSGGLSVAGSASGYSDELRFTSTTSGVEVAISSLANGASSMNFDHRATSNNAGFKWRNGTGAAVQLMELNGSGNLGLGVTPSAWVSAWKAIDVATGGASLYASLAIAGITNNAYLDSGIAWRYKSSYGAGRYDIGSTGQHTWFQAAAGTAGNAISFTQAMTLDGSGQLGLGVTTPGNYGRFVSATSVNGGVGGPASSITNSSLVATATGTSGSLALGIDASGTFYSWIQSTSTSNVALSLALNPNGGNVGIGTTSPLGNLHVRASSPNVYFQCDNTGSVTLNFGGTTTPAKGRILYTDNSDAFLFYTNSTERARIDSSGNLLVNRTSTTEGAKFVVNNADSTEWSSATVIFSAANGTKIFGLYNGTTGWNAASTVAVIGKNSTSSRSINAAGTVNASGGDYAEYMTKAGEFSIAKGDICGIDANGELTNVFTDAVTFAVKSTNPSYVGGDTWGAGFEKDDPELELARQKVDRIAFSGQVPVNVTNATPGDYIVPENDNGAIKGVAVSSPTLAQYQTAVGRVIAIEPDGRARIIVKVA